MTDGPFENTDREIWRGTDEGGGDHYADSLFITKDGGLGINCGGSVHVKPIREWHRLAGPIGLRSPPLAAGVREAAIEECAKLCENLRHKDYAAENEEWIAGTSDCAAAIRALAERLDFSTAGTSPIQEAREALTLSRPSGETL